ncbi:MAG: ROK family protein [Parvularculaceae bacterium]
MVNSGTSIGMAAFGAIELGGTKSVCAVADRNGKILGKKIIATRSPNVTFSEISGFFHNAANGPLFGIGVASFGPVDISRDSSNYGTILNTPKVDWAGVSILSALSEFEAPVAIDTDVNGAALGEFMYGAGQEVPTLAYVTVGTGIGVGILRFGEPLSGFGHYEMGHIRPYHDKDIDPYPGCCPVHDDCLEGLASGPALKARWGAPLNVLENTEKAIAAIDLEADYLAGLANTIIMTHMPHRIIFGGGVMKTEGLFDALKRKTAGLLGGYLDANEVSGNLETYIVRPGLGDDAGVIGAIELARRITS